jgi:hypothetical protein
VVMHFGQFWVIVIFAHFSLYFTSSYSKTSVSHYRHDLFCIERSECMATIILILIILYGISELSKVAFYASCRVETKSTKKLLYLKLTTISSAYKLTWFLYGQFFKIHTHSCFLCLETTATSSDKISTSLVAHMLPFGGI